MFCPNCRSEYRAGFKLCPPCGDIPLVDELAAELDDARFENLDPLVVDRLKREFYARLDALRRRASASYYSAKTFGAVSRLFPNVPTAAEIKNVETFAADFVARNGVALDSLMDQVSTEVALDASTRDLDELIVAMSAKRVRRTLVHRG